MRKVLLLAITILSLTTIMAQTNPAITAWLQNTSGIKGRYYLSGNVTPQMSAIDANVQQVQYSANYVYVSATGIPAYITGPFAIGTVTTAANNNYTFKLPLNPTAATTHTQVGMGAVAVFIDGTVAYRARDAASYHNQGQWHQNAIYFENLGFDCAHGHPGPMTSDYHQHQNPSAFNISSVPTSSICNVYLSDGLYVPDSTTHGPLIGFAQDGFPIYGAYGYTDPNDASSPIKRIRTSYRLRNITSRTTLPNGSSATGPALTDTIPSQLPGSTPLPAILGAYEEDYEYISGYGDLDEYNGRICKTPEYPNGIYCYFATIDSLNVPAYPYLLGDYYYGTVASGPPGSFTSATISEPVTTYSPSTAVTETSVGRIDVTVFPNPAKDLLVIQTYTPKTIDRKVTLYDINGKLVQSEIIRQGSTMCYFDLQTIYQGTYLVVVSDGKNSITKKIAVTNNFTK